MDWQAAGDWQGGTPGRPADLPALLAAFAHGGAWESVTQPKPSWHEWTTPTGRTYTQEPWRYIA